MHALLSLNTHVCTNPDIYFPQVRRIKTVRAMTRSRSNSITSSTSSAVTARLQSAMSRPQVPPPPPTLRQRLSRVLFGEKGNSLPGYAIGGLGYGNAGARGGKAQKIKMVGKGKDNQKQENPVARLKLLLVRSLACVFEVACSRTVLYT